MLISGIWAYVLLEALLIAGVYILYLHWINRRLARKTSAGHADSGPTTLQPDTGQYTAQLQARVLDTDAKLVEVSNQSDSDPQRSEILATHLAFLRAEQKAASDSETGSETFWSEIRETLSTLMQGTNVEAEENPTDQTRLINALQTRIQAYETRVANLEQFRVNFFELKEKYSQAIGLGQQLHAEVGKAFSEEQQTPELREAMQNLKEENSRLEEQLSLVEQEFDNIMRNLQAATDRSDLPPSESGITGSMDSIGQGVAKIRGVISTQEHRIQELTGIISELKIELSEKQRLESALDEFREKHNELSSVIGIIQEENDFLQEQISALLKQELEDRARSDGNNESLRQELEEQREAYAALEKQYATIEREYLAAYEENKRLKG